MNSYRGRLAPTPTGFLHLGHAATFAIAALRAQERQGTLIFRMEDLDPARCRPEYGNAAMEDLTWLGFQWQEGPIYQSSRTEIYLEFWRKLRDGGWIYPCNKSRKDVAEAAFAPHQEEPLFPAEWRPAAGTGRDFASPEGWNWRFRLKDDRPVCFDDERLGTFSRTAGVDFGDFLVWRRDGVPAYELAVVVDDLLMQITEVVRGEDLLTSTCRQLLLYEAFGENSPKFYHCPLVRDANGIRLAKRAGALSLRELRAAGWTPGQVFESLPKPDAPCES